LTRRNTQATAQATAEAVRAKGVASDQASWVHDIGSIHVMLASDAKGAADTLAAGLKTASDGLTSEQAGAANDLAEALAGAEKDYASGNASAQASTDKQMAQIDGTLSKGLTDVANDQREGISEKRGEYEVALYAQHAAAMDSCRLGKALPSRKKVTDHRRSCRTAFDDSVGLI
jgi:hypothetical protein